MIVLKISFWIFIKKSIFFIFKEDGWDIDFFVLIEIDGKLFGRGLIDDKVEVIEL